MVLLLVMVTLLLFLIRSERRIERTKLSPYFILAAAEHLLLEAQYNTHALNFMYTTTTTAVLHPTLLNTHYQSSKSVDTLSLPKKSTLMRILHARQH